MTQTRPPVPRRRVFLHFVDDELVLRLPGARRANLEAVATLTTVVAFCSPESPIFPLSARHELRELAALLETLAPLVAGDFLDVTGAGATPLAYLESRRTQYESAGRRDEALFDSSEDVAVQSYAENWVAKRGSTTTAIARRWEDNVLAGEGGLLALVSPSYKAARDSVLASLVSLPRELPGQPLIAPVLLEELARKRLVRTDLSAGAIDTLTAFLCSEWAQLYAGALDAYLLCDLGHALPAMNGFLPLTTHQLSARRLETMLQRLGLYNLLQDLALPISVALWHRAQNARVVLAEDLWARGTSLGTPLWSQLERPALKAFDRATNRRANLLARRARTQQARAEGAFERRLWAYADLCESSAFIPPAIMVDRSIKIDSLSGGNVQLSSGDASTLNQNVTQTSELVGALRGALQNDAEAAGFGAWLQSRNDQELDAKQIAKGLATELGPALEDDTVKDRARRIAAQLSSNTAGSLLAAGVVAVLKLLGL